MVGHIIDVRVPIRRADLAGSRLRFELDPDSFLLSNRDREVRDNAENAAALALQVPLECPHLVAQDLGLGFWPLMLALLSLLSHNKDRTDLDEQELPSA